MCTQCHNSYNLVVLPGPLPFAVSEALVGVAAWPPLQLAQSHAGAVAGLLSLTPACCIVRRPLLLAALLHALVCSVRVGDDEVVGAGSAPGALWSGRASAPTPPRCLAEPVPPCPSPTILS